MPKKKAGRLPTQMEVWKGIRKDPVPPGHTHRAKDRDIRDEQDEDDISRWLEWRGEDFENFEED